ATDNCDVTPGVHFSQETIDSTCINNFKVIRKWWAKDACGNTSDTLTQLITVHDDVKPVITADFDKTVNVQCLKDIPAAPKPTATDNCNGDVQPIYTETSSGSACDSTITRKWVFADACGNCDSVTQVINIKDNIKPILSGSADDVNVTCYKDIPATANISATDNCTVNPVVYFSQKVLDSTCVNKLKVIRKWWAKDACGNTSDTLKQLITINDDVKPVITAGFDKAVNIQCLKDIPAAPKPTATDNCNGDIQPVYSETGSGSACDSTITRKWVFTDACGNKDSVTQIINIKDNIKPILSGSTNNITVACYKDIPAAAGLTATDNCTIKPVVYFNQKVYDSTCVNKFKVIRKWWAKDVCGNTSDTLTQLITVYDNVKPVITANFNKIVYVQCQKDIPAAPSATATDNCSGNIQPVFTQKGIGCSCDSLVTRKWVFTDACGNKDSVMQLILIKDITAPVITYKPADVTVPCASPVVFGTPVFSDNCGAVTVTYLDRKEGTTCPFRYIRKWTAKDKCNNSVSVEQAVTVSCCQATFCSYTQGYYGNTNGSACTPSGTSTTAKQIMSAAVDVQAGDSVIFGLKATSKYFTLFLGDITNDNIFKMLPGGGTPSALKGYATFNKTNTWGNVPLLTTSNNVGKINNVLLSQTMSLFFNMYVTTTLKNLTIDGDTLLTAKLTACGSNTPGTTVNKYILPPAVVNYLKSAGKANVSGLYELANMYLGGQTVAGLAIGDVSKAVDAINNAFDKCATLVGWTRSSAISTVKVSTTTLSMNDPKAMEPVIEEVKLNVTVFPNPYRDKLIFRFIAPISGKVKLEVYNLLGQQIGQLNYGMVDKGTQHTIEYNVPVIHRDVLLYRLSVGDLFKTGKAIHAKE
ncbi:HYR-like domain-containing protein, partial [Chitinophaga filiformis]